MIEVTLPSGNVQVYVITKLFGGPHASSPVPAEDARRALVRTLSGDSPNFPATATAGASFKFIKAKHFEGVGSQRYRAEIDGQTDPVLFGQMYHAVTPAITDDLTGNAEIDPGYPEFYARARTRSEVNNTGDSPYALMFGGFNPATHLQ
jgi:hypothetical protein